MAGMIPKTVDSLSRHGESNRHSLSPSPHAKLNSSGSDNKPRYQKELEEVRLRTSSERTRTDSERTLTDNESSGRMDFYGVARSSSIGR